VAYNNKKITRIHLQSVPEYAIISGQQWVFHLLYLQEGTVLKKLYKKPEIRSEILKVGVYGDYTSGGGALGSFVGAFNPMFGLCCS
jgi:hypothetical protein